MKKSFATFILVIFTMIITNTTVAADKNFDGYLLGSGSLFVSEEHSVNIALRVGGGLEFNERYGLELFWDFTGVEPRNLIQKANLPMTIAPIETEVQSYSYHYLTALAVGTFPLREPFSLVGKVGLARHSQSIEFDALSSGTILREDVEVDESEFLPVVALGFELDSTRFEKLSLEFSLTNYFGDSSKSFLLSAAAKIMF